MFERPQAPGFPCNPGIGQANRGSDHVPSMRPSFRPLRPSQRRNPTTYIDTQMNTHTRGPCVVSRRMCVEVRCLPVTWFS